MILNNTHATPRGIILAGTQSWGGCVLDEFCSRALLPLLGRPVIWFALDWLRRSGIRQVSICGNRNTAAIREQLGDGSAWEMSLDYLEDPMPRGTAGCILDAATSTTAEEWVAVDATFLTSMDLNELLAAHRSEGASLTVMAGKNPAYAGPNHLQPAGAYIISRPALEHVSATTYQDIKEMWIPRLYQQGLKVFSHQIGLDSYLRVLNGRSYLNAMEWAIRQLQRTPQPEAEYRQVGSALVHATARVAATARLVGPCVIGPRTQIKPDTTVIGPSAIGADCVLDNASIVSHTAVWSHAQVGTQAIVDRSVLVSGSRLEAGTVLRDTVWGDRKSTPPTRDLYWRMGAGQTASPAVSPARTERPARAIPAERPAPVAGAAVVA